MVLLSGEWLIKALHKFVDHLSSVHFAKKRQRELHYCIVKITKILIYVLLVLINRTDLMKLFNLFVIAITGLV